MKIIIASLLIASLFGCSPSKDQIAQTIKENPEIILDAIKNNPVKFVETFQEAIKEAQGDMAKKREEEEKKKLEESYSNPLTPNIRKDESIRGDKDAPLTLVEYSDFECPYCGRGFQTVMSLLEKYGKNIKFIYKHLPLSFHKHAMTAAKYYEAIRIQSPEKAYKFHDAIYKNQSKLQMGEKFLQVEAKNLGIDMGKLKKDVDSKEVEDRINEDMEEAAKYDMQGTPGFILNGVPVRGAYPASHFYDIVEELKKRGKVKL